MQAGMQESIRGHAQTVTGADTCCTLLSSTKTSRARWHRTLTSDSEIGSHRFSCSIHLSRSPPIEEGRTQSN